MVKALFENKADINLQDRNGWTPLHCAASKGSFDICAFLVDNNADVDALNRDGTSAIHYLVRAHLQQKDYEVNLYIVEGLIIPQLIFFQRRLLLL